MGKSRRHPTRDRLRRALALAAVGASLAASGCVSGPIAGSAQSSAAATGASTATADRSVEAPAPLEAGSTEASPTPSATPTPTPTRTPSATPTPARTAATSSPFAGFFALGAVVQGPGEFRIGTTDWYIQVPAGMRLRWDYSSDPDVDGDVRWGWSDVESGSQMVVSARDVTDVARILTGESAARARADRNFDAVMNSVSRQTTE